MRFIGCKTNLLTEINKVIDNTNKITLMMLIFLCIKLLKDILK